MKIYHVCFCLVCVAVVSVVEAIQCYLVFISLCSNILILFLAGEHQCGGKTQISGQCLHRLRQYIYGRSAMLVNA